MDYQHVMVDEFFEDIHLLLSKSKEELKAFFVSKLTVWIAISNEYRRNPESILNTDELMETYFSDFIVTRMDAALRMTENNAMRIKSNYEKIQKLGGLKLNGRLCAELKVPPNLVEGWKPKIIGLDKGGLISESIFTITILKIFTLGWKVEDSISTHFFEDVLKVKIPSDIKPPLK